MKRFPRIYAESTIARMYKKLDLPSETTDLLHRYFNAFCNLYQILSLRDAYKIIDRQNSGLLTMEQFIAFSEIARHENHFYYILAKDELYRDAPEEDPIDREIVEESLVDIDFDEYYNMSEAQYGKPLKIIPKEEMLRYSSVMYIPDTPQVRAIRVFLRKKLKMSAKKAEDLIGDLIVIITCDDNVMEGVKNELERMGIIMSADKLLEFIDLFYDLNNNTRNPRNRGFTQYELSNHGNGYNVPQIMFGENIRNGLKSGIINANDLAVGITDSELPNDVKMHMIGEMGKARGNNITVKKIGRNDPCPCGSGKKYKKCCGR